MPDVSPHSDSSPAARFWDEHYRTTARPWTGRPNAILRRFAEPLAVGQALDLGCGEGNSAIWLAERGWRVTGVDVAAAALARAAAHAAAAGVTERTTFVQHDLGSTFPAGQFDLVYALYLESPVALPRDRVLRAAADAVAPGGLLLVVDHASVAPWSWDQHAVFPTPEEAFDRIGLDLGRWHREFLGAPQREATGPGGQVAVVADTVIALRNVGR